MPEKTHLQKFLHDVIEALPTEEAYDAIYARLWRCPRCNLEVTFDELWDAADGQISCRNCAPQCRLCYHRHPQGEACLKD